jgi:hypothetical protein
VFWTAFLCAATKLKAPALPVVCVTDPLFLVARQEL